MEKAMEARVLLVDDEEDFLETLSSRLELRGLKVSAVTSGEQAVSEAKQQEYDAIVEYINTNPINWGMDKENPG